MATTDSALCASNIHTEVPDSKPLPALIALNNVLHIGALISLVGMLVVAKLSPNVHRATIWYTFITAWIVYGSTFLMIIGHQQGPPPDHTVCLAQAALLYAGAPMVMFACLGLMVQVYVSCTGLLTSRRTEANHILYLVHVAPFFLYGVVIIESLRVGSLTPEVVVRDVSGMYCNFSSDTIRWTAATLIMAGAFVVLWLETCIAYVLYRNWHRFTRLNCGTTATSSGLYSLSFILRAAIFCTMTTGGLVSGFILCLYNYSGWTALSSSAFNLLTTAGPVGCAVIFGTQEDMLRAILFWRRPKAPRSRVTGTILA